MMKRFPRLSVAKAGNEIESLQGFSFIELEKKSRNISAGAMSRFAATGLPKISAVELVELRKTLDAVARDAGFPGTSLVIRQRVDSALAVTLASLELPAGEMLRADVWTWMTIHLMPYFVKWRWGGKSGCVTAERFAGPIYRNALGRLWLRGLIFDRGERHVDRWGLAEAISEDAALAIMERTSVSANHRLARAVGECWLEAKKTGLNADQLLRDAMIRIRVHSSMVEMCVLSDNDIANLVVGNFSKATTRVRPRAASRRPLS